MTTGESAATVVVTLSGVGHRAAAPPELVPVDAAAWHSWPEDERRECVASLAAAAADRVGAPVRASAQWPLEIALPSGVTGREMRALSLTAHPAAHPAP